MEVKIKELKEKALNALQKDKFDDAVAAYTEAITLDGVSHFLFSNRSAAYVGANKYEEALKDAEQAIALNPTWPKGYFRKSVALNAMKKHREAELSCTKGLEFDADNKRLQQELYHSLYLMFDECNVENMSAMEWITHGDIYMKFEEPFKASAAYLKALEIDPQNTTALERCKVAGTAQCKSPKEMYERSMDDPDIHRFLRDSNEFFTFVGKYVIFKILDLD